MNKYGVSSLPTELTTCSNFELEAKLHELFRITSNRECTLSTKKWQNKKIFGYIFPDGSFCTISFDDIHIPKWEYSKNLVDFNLSYKDLYLFREIDFVNSAYKILQSANPYAYNYAIQEEINPHFLLLYPNLEQLKKAGYKIADTMINSLSQLISPFWKIHVTVSDIQEIGRTFHKGTSLYNIIGFPRDIAQEMKDIDDLALWSACRKLYKKNMLDVESIRFLKQGNYSLKDIRNIYSVVSGIDGKQYFTVPSLIQHLRRLDMYEAINTQEALQLLSDYIRCCHALDVTPRFDTDSLKREHDVMARNARTVIEQKRKTEMVHKMKGANLIAANAKVREL